MSDLALDISRLFVRELEGFKRELDLFPDEETPWQTINGVTNSAANLAIHVAGGLQYLVGGVLGGTGYVRDREAEFKRRSGTRQDVRAELDRTIAVVQDVLGRISDTTLAAAFPEPVFGVTFRTSAFLMHLCAHAAFHLGQAGYLRRALTGDSRSSGPIPLAPLGRNG